MKVIVNYPENSSESTETYEVLKIQVTLTFL